MYAEQHFNSLCDMNEAVKLFEESHKIFMQELSLEKFNVYFKPVKEDSDKFDEEI